MIGKAKENYGSRFLYAEDLLVDGEFRTAKVTIDKFHSGGTLQAADGKLVDKPAISFAGRDKILVLCKTNASILHFVTGQQPGDKWVGHQITLQVRIVEAFGELVPAIRVIPPAGCPIRKQLIKRLGTKAEWKSNT